MSNAEGENSAGSIDLGGRPGAEKMSAAKSLNAEYAALMAEKKTACSECRKAREGRKELLTAKANIDRFLGRRKSMENQKRQKKKRRSSVELTAIKQFE